MFALAESRFLAASNAWSRELRRTRVCPRSAVSDADVELFNNHVSRKCRTLRTDRFNLPSRNETYENLLSSAKEYAPKFEMLENSLFSIVIFAKLSFIRQLDNQIVGVQCFVKSQTSGYHEINKHCEIWNLLLNRSYPFEQCVLIRAIAAVLEQPRYNYVVRINSPFQAIRFQQSFEIVIDACKLGKR